VSRSIFDSQLSLCHWFLAHTCQYLPCDRVRACVEGGKMCIVEVAVLSRAGLFPGFLPAS